MSDSDMVEIKPMPTITEAMSRRIVSYRYYGLNGEKRRAIVHRFEIKGGDTLRDLWEEVLFSQCALTKYLTGEHTMPDVESCLNPT